MVFNAERNAVRFFNPALNRYSEDAEGSPVIPKDMLQDDEGDWYFEDPLSGEVADIYMEEFWGWDLCWDVSEQVFYWRCETTGEISMMSHIARTQMISVRVSTPVKRLCCQFLLSFSIGQEKEKDLRIMR